MPCPGYRHLDTAAELFELPSLIWLCCMTVVQQTETRIYCALTLSLERKETNKQNRKTTEENNKTAALQQDPDLGQGLLLLPVINTNS